MRKLIVTVLLVAAAFTAQAQSLFNVEETRTYIITESTSLGGSAKITQDLLVGINTGNVSGKIVFNVKGKFIRFSDKKFNYDPEKFRVQNFDHFCLTSGKGTMPGQSGEIIFQLIEDLEGNSINLLVQWPDYSAVKIVAVLKED